jgi:26S proteasome regulatory subunit T1
MGVKELDTGLAPPNLWDLPADKMRHSSEHPLQVARCTKIIKCAPLTDAQQAAAATRAAGGSDLPPNADEQDKYVINVRQIAKFVVALGDKVSPTDIEEGMRVGSVSLRSLKHRAD